MADQSTNGAHFINADAHHKVRLAFESVYISPEYTVSEQEYRVNVYSFYIASREYTSPVRQRCEWSTKTDFDGPSIVARISEYFAPPDVELHRPRDSSVAVTTFYFNGKNASWELLTVQHAYRTTWRMQLYYCERVGYYKVEARRFSGSAPLFFQVFRGLQTYFSERKACYGEDGERIDVVLPVHPACPILGPPVPPTDRVPVKEDYLPLISMCQSGDRSQAISALARVTRALPDEPAKAYLRNQAMVDAGVIPAFVEALISKDPHIRYSALYGLHSLLVMDSGTWLTLIRQSMEELNVDPARLMVVTWQPLEHELRRLSVGLHHWLSTAA